MSVKDSEFFYKLDMPKGAVVNAILSVDAGSPDPAKLTMYDEKQSYITNITVAVGKSDTLSHIFNNEGGTTVYLVLQGNSSVSLQATAMPQNDGGTGVDAGDTTDTATPVSLGSLSGLLGDDDNQDFYLITLPKSGGTLSVIYKTNDNVKLTILNEKAGYVNDTQAARNDDKPASIETILPAEEGGKWYLEFSGSGAYTSTVRFTNQNDGNSGGDAGASADRAVPVTPGRYTGLLGGDDTDDYYSIDLPKSGGVLSVTFQSTHDVKLTLHDNNDGYVADTTAQNGDNAPAAIQYILPSGQGGTWYLQFSGDGNYNFNVSFTGQNDAGSGKDAGDSVDAALAVTSPEFSGMLGGADTEDFYKIPGMMGHKVSVTYDGTGRLKVTMHTATGDYIADTSVEGSGTAELSDDSSNTADYVLEFSGGDGTYSVKISK